MKKAYMLCLVLFFVGCSHNAAIFTIGKQLKIGNAEYGEISYINGIAIVDLSRENSGWEMEIDEEDGLQYDSKTGTVKGVKKIKRNIGKQITGYLVDLAETDSKAVEKYLSDNVKSNTAQENVNKSE